MLEWLPVYRTNYFCQETWNVTAGLAVKVWVRLCFMSRTKNLFRHFTLFTNFTGSKIWPQFLRLVAFSRPSFETQQRICHMRNSEALMIILYFGRIWCSLAHESLRIIVTVWFKPAKITQRRIYVSYASAAFVRGNRAVIEVHIL